jgi:hypothetical protein
MINDRGFDSVHLRVVGSNHIFFTGQFQSNQKLYPKAYSFKVFNLIILFCIYFSIFK